LADTSWLTIYFIVCKEYLKLNNINAEQNSPAAIELLMVQRRLYSRAKNWQGALYAASLAVASVPLFVGGKPGAIQQYIPVISLAFLATDILFIAPYIKSLTSKAARCQELFDTKVLSMRHNSVVAGPPLSMEEIDSVQVNVESIESLSETEKEYFLNWYKGIDEKLPLSVARVICQRMNVFYDKALREQYVWALGIASALISSILIIVGVTKELPVGDLLATWVSPLIPLITIVGKEICQQRATYSPTKNLCGELEGLYQEAIASVSSTSNGARVISKNSELMLQKSRQIQDAIFRHRENSPLIFDFFYKWRRPSNEKVAEKSAKRSFNEVNAKNK